MSPAGPAELRRRLAELETGLRPVAETVLTESGRIDVVALDDGGGAVAVFDAEGEDLAAVTRALAATAWLDRHLPDWVQIAPDLGIDPALPARAVLLAEAFDPDTRVAAKQLRAPRIELLETHPAARRPDAQDADRVTRPPPPAAAAPRRPPTAAARAPSEPTATRHPFRTGLTDADLGLPESPAPAGVPAGAPD